MDLLEKYNIVDYSLHMIVVIKPVKVITFVRELRDYMINGKEEKQDTFNYSIKELNITETLQIETGDKLSCP